MKALLVTWGTEGDTRPVLALAQGLQASGHEVLVMADRNGQPLAEALGIGFDPMPGDFKALMAGGGATGEMVRKGQSPARIWPQLVRDFARPAMRQVQERLDDGVDLLVGSSMCKVPAEVVAGRRGIPTVGIDLQPFTPTRDFPPPLLDVTTLPAWANLPLYGAMNLAFGMARAALAPTVPRAPGRRRTRVPQFGAWSPTLVPRPRDWPADKPVVTGELQLRTPTEPLEPALRDFVEAGEAPVFVGLGSMAGVDMTHFRRTAVQALQGRRAVLSAGWNDFTGELAPGALGPDLFAVQRAPFDWLFPRCSVLVHHAGAGTAHLAARSGRPNVCVPQMADQSFWAAQFHRLGIAPPPLDRDSVTVDGLRRALDAAEALSGRSRELAQSMREEDGVAAAVRLVERVAA